MQEAAQLPSKEKKKLLTYLLHDLANSQEQMAKISSQLDDPSSDNWVRYSEVRVDLLK